jgi:PhnB protein
MEKIAKYHSVNPYLVVRNAGRAIEFYKKAFGAEEREE